MKTFYERLGIKRYINAHDTYTIYGGSRISKESMLAMEEASKHFTDIFEMQRVLGEKIAEMTHNEGAFITNGAAGGLKLAAAVCMVEGSDYLYSQLPDTKGAKNEIIVIRSQRNVYDVAIRGAGATIVEIGNADRTSPYELEGKINEKTAAVFYFLASIYAKSALPLKEVIEIAHKKGVPVVVDAAAQLPPVENLWELTAMGVDLAIFSGGKTLCGPQDSGLILGKKSFIRDCIKFGAPVNGICRDSKTSREAMAGLFVALEQYLLLDQQAEYTRLEKMALRLGEVFEEIGLEAKLVPHGPVGQIYPRIFGKCLGEGQALEITAAMKEQRIYIGCDPLENSIFISPLNLNECELEQVEQALRRAI